MTPTREQRDSRPRTRGPQFEERRRQIALAAARVFATKGFAGATNRDIAAEAGISAGLIYWYYNSKEELFTAIFDQFAPFYVVRDALETADALPVEEVLQRLANGLFRAIGQPEYAAILRLGLTEAIRFPDVAGHVGHMIARHPIGGLAAYFERQIAAGRIRPVDPWLAAQAFLGSVLGYALRKHVVGHDDLQEVDDAEMAATLAGLFTRGLLAGDGTDGGPDGTDR
ncbi:TetR/AcrR family transcriptional regulator [Sphaerobacter sp.]|uniref:TetR/AcrR family transcriptional regulator n=1 Tax=Sphaerobacter sp. TaxID=2099654 RepID=UPI001D7CC0AD|nr:TetR/AcrR family transcriptional regulator [Sphaerobacter sp.]MBX5444829.1 TetR/AcrR family transcriptional regulator [Sphaerobacter sp.]